MHPAIREASEREIRAAEVSGRRICIVDAALILEAGRRDRFHKIVVVAAPAYVQVDRLVRSRGLTPTEAWRRLSSQWTTAAKAALADFVIDNGRDLLTTEEQVTQVYAALEDIHSEAAKKT
jgi:dephospho-CoA kinase